jgi:hypothetical protein
MVKRCIVINITDNTVERFQIQMKHNMEQFWYKNNQTNHSCHSEMKE